MGMVIEDGRSNAQTYAAERRPPHEAAAARPSRWYSQSLAGIFVLLPAQLACAIPLAPRGLACRPHGIECRWLDRTAVVTYYAVLAAVIAVSFILMSTARTYAGLTFAALANGIGAGLILPAMVTWNMRELPYSHRGVGVGAFQSSLFLGMSVNPLVIVSLAKWQGNREATTAVLGGALLVSAVITLIIALRAPSIPQRFDGKPLM